MESSKSNVGDVLLSLNEVAEILGLARNTLHNKKTRDRLGLPFIKIGKYLGMWKSALMKWIQSREICYAKTSA